MNYTGNLKLHIILKAAAIAGIPTHRIQLAEGFVKIIFEKEWIIKSLYANGNEILAIRSSISLIS